MTRIFIGTRLQQHPALDLLLDELAQAGNGWRVVPGQALHATYRFLGEVDSQRVPDLKAAIERRVTGPAFDVAVQGVGVFPDWRRPRVVWAGLDDSEGRMVALASQVEQAMADQGLPAEARAFRPHVTIARVRARFDGDLLKRVVAPRREQAFGTMTVDRVSILTSTLTPTGAQYAAAAEVLL